MTTGYFSTTYQVDRLSVFEIEVELADRAPEV
jgi:hypothetical protein